MKPSESQKELGEKIKKLRTEGGKTKKEIACVMGISVYRYTNIENGKGVFYLEQAKRLVKHYNIPLDDLIK